MSNWLYNLFGDFACLLGFHHYHEMDSDSPNDTDGKKVKMILPPGVHLKAEVCCRCKDINIKDLKIDDEPKT